MNKNVLTTVLAGLMLASTSLLQAQVIGFSMDAEQQEQNTPEGWTAVQLPKNLPTLTEQNTFYINKYGATTSSADNTAAIQAALDACATAGGGMVVVPAGTWKFGRIQVGSKTILHLCAGATLKLLSFAEQTDHTTKEPYITGKSNASDIVIEGESNETSIIEGQGGPWWDAVEQNVSGLQRGSFIRFYQGSRYLYRNFRMQNAPSTNLTLGNNGKGTHHTVHHVSIYAPSSSAEDPSHNTDGIPMWADHINIYDCDIDTGDDNVVTDRNAQYVHVWNCRFGAGHGASLGSYTQDMHDIIYEGITFEGTGCGFRLKSNRDRSGDVYNIVFRNCTMKGVETPIQITAWYDQLPDSPQSAATEAVIGTTPRFHDILIQNVTATNPPSYTVNPKNGYCVMIYGRPESLVKDVTFDNVNVSNNKGLKMNFCEGIRFINGCKFRDAKRKINSTDDSVADLIEEQYLCSYSWNGKEPAVVLNSTTYLSEATNSGTTSYTFNDGYTISNTNGKSYAAGNGNTLKYSVDMDYTISVPEGKAINAITFKGYGNGKNGETTYLTHINGQELNQNDYAYANRNELDSPEKYVAHNVTFDSPVQEPVTFRVGGAQACFIITLDVTTPEPPTAISAMRTDAVVINSHDIYDLQGRKVAAPTRGLYIVNGRKVIVK